jgi:hypothetical protein
VQHSELRFALAASLAAVLGASGAHADSPSEVPTPRRVSAFVDLEWRLMGLADHVSHGPAFALGAAFFQGALRVGVGGLSRPGPFNPTTFDQALPNGTYKGQSVVALRSDGAMAGLHIGFSHRLFIDRLALQLPLTVGYGGFGFYLAGDDRKTPDGRRVSDWENELFADQDSYLGVVIDAGARLRYQPRTWSWVAPYLGVAYTVVPGFRTLARNDYSGFSFVLGIEMGPQR